LVTLSKDTLNEKDGTVFIPDTQQYKQHHYISTLLSKFHQSQKFAISRTTHMKKFVHYEALSDIKNIILYLKKKPKCTTQYNLDI